MPSINRIRVNNVKYNFGTQGYDDFSMRMYGRNTLYDLANGGGKSVLMLLLMQNLIPNCTLDDKQPIEKLFRDPSNTVIHSLIEWKLDECDIKDGMRYMTTGFAAKKAATTDEERADGTAQIEYFNYVIFYRDYNKNDIINLPLVKESEHISYKALRNYLHDLARNDKNILVQVFDRKGEYQRFIADYGLYESQWEIIRGINKTEGHVRTYFESNYKTTRRVIEDLLIEEIIEKAYQTKTRRETDKTDSTVSLLMTIQDELRELAEKKKGIELYDHEQELVQILIDRIQSFTSLYEEQEKAAKECGRVLVTLEQEKAGREERLNELNVKLESGKSLLKDTGLLLEVLKIYRDVQELEKREELQKEREEELTNVLSQINTQDREYKERVAVSEYIILKKARAELEALTKERKEASSDSQDIYTVVANIRDRIDKLEEGLEEKKVPLQKELEDILSKVSSLEKQRSEGETELAVIDSKKEYIKSELKAFNKSLYELESKSDFAGLMDTSTQMNELKNRNDKLTKTIQEDEARAEEIVDQKKQLSEEYEQEAIEEKSLIRRRDELELTVEAYKKNAPKYKSICSVYMDSKTADPEQVIESISERMSGAVVKIYELERRIEELEKTEKDIRSGRLILPSKAVEKVIEYLLTRHGMDAMFGMDYVSALPDEKKEEILSKIPGLPYGVIVSDIAGLMNDPGIKELDIDEEVILYDRESLDDASVILGNGVESVRRNRDYFTDPRYLDQKLHLLGGELDNQREELKSNEAVLETLRDDREFVRTFIEKQYLGSEAALEEVKQAVKETQTALEKLKEKLSSLEREDAAIAERIKENKTALEQIDSDREMLQEIISVQSKISDLSGSDNHLSAEKKRISKKIDELTEAVKKNKLRETDIRLSLDEMNNEKLKLEYRWENKFAIYYVEDTAFPYVDMGLSELEEAFDVALGGTSDSRMSLEKEKLLRDTLSNTVERQTRAIEQLGLSVKSLDAIDKTGALTGISEEMIGAAKTELDRLTQIKENLGKELAGLENEKARIEGSIEYAGKQLESSYGCTLSEGLGKLEDKYKEDVQKSLDSVKNLYDKQKAELASVEAELRSFDKAARNNDDLLRLASRIVTESAIDTNELSPIEDAGDIRERFEGMILGYDKLAKSIDRAKADMLKVKMMVYDTLSQMGVAELAASIRDDVIIPSNKNESSTLLKKLGDVVEIIVLEKNRIEKSLVSMEQLKDNFVDQCVERCLDVRSELDKLTRLSEITMDNQKIQMIRLTIPYVKDEFIKDRMSEYIDRIVEEVDKKENDSERQKYLNSCLAMKKLFSVIVTDMSKIKLLLYKRERIREQSRYLRYEEAVGSTGQSQGIYIQFLISIINYISGMYATTSSASRSKTLFIDNPFGAAKDIYIWEPIFKLLEENSCQLIVPARGATPEITGRFDINYVLGQQMTGNRTTTVVVSFSSKTKGEELEYKELDYEQQSFDFI